MWETIIEALKEFVAWLFGIFQAAAEALLGVLLAVVPDDLQPSIDLLTPYLALANYWVPLDFGFTLLTTYISLYVAVVAYRFIKQWIPTLSG